MTKLLFTYLCFLTPVLLIGQSAKKDLSEAYDLYNNGKFEESSKRYEQALTQEPRTLEGKFNLGDSYFREERYEEAASAFQESIDLAQDDLQKSKAWHNLGNAQIQSGKLKESIESYKQALRLNPKDEDARYNLAYAKKKLKEQEQQQKDQQKQDKDNKDQQDQKDQKDQQKQDQDKGDKKDDQEKQDDQKGKDQDKQKDQDQKGDQKDKGQEDQQKQPKPQPGEEKENEISKEDAQRILEALKNQEQETQDKLRKQKMKNKAIKIEKDW